MLPAIREAECRRAAVKAREQAGVGTWSAAAAPFIAWLLYQVPLGVLLQFLVGTAF